jgi:hypothetical protein
MTQTEKQKRYVAHISALLLGEESEFCDEFGRDDEEIEKENENKNENKTEKREEEKRKNKED